MYQYSLRDGGGINGHLMAIGVVNLCSGNLCRRSNDHPKGLDKSARYPSEGQKKRLMPD